MSNRNQEMPKMYIDGPSILPYPVITSLGEQKG